MLYREILLADYRVGAMSNNHNAENKDITEQDKQKAKQRVIDRACQGFTLQLLNEHWKAGDTLPSEASLCKMFGVHRNALRDAMKLYEDKGIFIKQQGANTKVSENFAFYMLRDEPDLIVRLNPEEFHCMLEFRQSVEMICAGLAAGRAREEDLNHLARALTAMTDNQANPEAFSVAECDFHFALIGAAHNVIWSRALKAVENDFLASIAELNENGISAENLAAHEVMLQALKKQDPVAAARAMEHILVLAVQASEDVVHRRAESEGEQSPVIFDNASSASEPK